MGKTSLALQAAIATAGRGVPVGIVSLEMSPAELSRIVAGCALGIQPRALRDQWDQLPEASRADVRMLADAWKDNGLVSVMSGTGDETMQHIAAWARLRAQVGGLGLLIIDYLGLIAGTDPRQNEYARLTEITRQAKNLARALSVPVLLLAQLNREVDKAKHTKTPRPPVLSDLRGSGSIEQDADAVVFIHRPGDDAGRRVPVQLVVAKNRGGPLAMVDALFDRPFQRFHPIAPEVPPVRAAFDDPGRDARADALAAEMVGG